MRISISRTRPTVKTLAENLIRRCVEGERTYLAALWLDRVAGYNAAVDAGLSVQSFSDRRLGFVFWYVCRCTEEHFTPTMGECLTLAPRADVPIDHRDTGFLFRLILAEDTQAGHVGHYAARLARLAGIRDGRARELLGELEALAVDDREASTILTYRRRLPSPGTVTIRKGLRPRSVKGRAGTLTR